MNRRAFSWIVGLLAIALGGIVIAAIAYTAGASTVPASGTAAAAPWHYGAHFGWGLWFLFPLFFFILFFILIRAAVWGYRGPRHWHGYGPGYGPSWGPDRHGSPEEFRSRRDEAMDEWHRRAHEAENRPTGPAEPGGPAGPTS